MRRRLLAGLAVCLLALTAGCAGLGGGIGAERLDERPPEPYDWNTSANATITVHGGGAYQAVYNLTNTTELEVYRRGLGNDRPLSVRAVRYRYPNGSVINGSKLTVYVRGNHRVIEVPNGSGMLAFTGSSRPKEFGTPAFLKGSYELILPPGHRVESFLFGEVNPPNYETTIDDRGRLHVTWEQVDRGVYVRYYLVRDVIAFRGAVAVLTVVGAIGMLYYYRKVQELKEKRRELGLDVDTDDDFGNGGPPPGMK